MMGSRRVNWMSRWHPTRLVRVSIAVALAIAGVVLVWVAIARPSTPGSALADASGEQETPAAAPKASSPSPVRPTARGDQTDVRDKITGLVLPESHPEVVSIPRIGVRSRLVDLGLAKGEMETPGDPAVAGWFDRGPTPGALGPAVIAGHVTWNGAPEVFYRLGTLRPGDHVDVARKDGKTAVFTVTRVARFSKSRFPTRAVYGAIDHAGLRLITCGGTYDAAEHNYLDNVVVFARLTAVRGASG
jgi:sortase (surface protein transpeptidase)